MHRRAAIGKQPELRPRPRTLYVFTFFASVRDKNTAAARRNDVLYWIINPLCVPRKKKKNQSPLGASITRDARPPKLLFELTSYTHSTFQRGPDAMQCSKWRVTRTADGRGTVHRQLASSDDSAGVAKCTVVAPVTTAVFSHRRRGCRPICSSSSGDHHTIACTAQGCASR